MQTNVLSKMLCILFCLIATCIPAMGQSGNYSVKGVLVDSLTNDTEPYATIRILSAKSPDKPVKLNVTDEKGRFNEKLTQPGDYIITLTSVGKKTVERKFTLSASQKQVDLGTLYTAEASEMLKGVEVVAQKTAGKG